MLLGSATFVLRDYSVFGYPIAHYHRECFWRGELPLWNPLNNCGLPFLAQWNTMTLYPGSLCYLLLPLPWSLGFFMLLHLWLGGLGAYAVARRWTGLNLAAAVAGVAYAFHGLTQQSLMWPNNIAALGLLPWVLLTVESGVREGGRKLVVAALLGAVQMLTGAPEVILFTWCICGALLVADCMKRKTESVSQGPLTHYASRFTGLISLVTLLAAAQLLPFLDLLRHSQRDTGFGDSVWSLPAWGFANYLVPLFRCVLTSPGVPLHSGQNWTSSYYAGAGVLALALLAVLRVSDRRSRVLSLFGAICLVLALGQSGFLYSLFERVLPLGVMRYPVKFVIPLTFILPMLAAFALKELFRDSGAGSRRREETNSDNASSTPLSLAPGFSPVSPPANEGEAVSTASSAPETAEAAEQSECALDTGFQPGSNESNDPLSTLNPQLSTSPAAVDETRARMARHRLRAITAVMTAAIALIAVLGWFNPLAGEGLETHLLLLFSALASGLFVVFTAAAVLGLRHAESRWRQTLWSLAVLGLLFADLRLHLPNLTPRVPPGYLQPGQPDLQALSPAPRDGTARASLTWSALKEFKSKMLSSLADTLLLQRIGLYDNLNLLEGLAKTDGIFSLYLRPQQEVEARLFLSGGTNSLPGPLADFLGIAHVSSPTNIFKWHRRDTALPLITTGQRPEFSAADISLPAMAAANWSPAEVVFLHPWDKALVFATNTAAAKVLSTKWAAQRIECEVESPAPTLVVIAQSFYHPWKATVNGQPANLLRANHAFQAVLVPAGRSMVRLDYVDRRFQLGLVLSALGLIACGVLWWRAGRMPAAQ
ncbi:MAG: hypothetical protein B9S33_10005 [Pedosphaera sp. Tous-C6FEB]|nr:MAG: hypothetical protein B9S33_10005 [Pedosphaera sp. Tous-C6FEB]